MSVDYIVSSLPALKWGEKAPLTWKCFCSLCEAPETGPQIPAAWNDLETQLRNAVAQARGGARYVRAASGCSVFWQKRIRDCFGEKDVLRRDEQLDRVWWDAAGELTPPTAPLGRGALATYSIRLKIALRRSLVSPERGNAAFDRLTEKTRLDFNSDKGT